MGNEASQQLKYGDRLDNDVTVSWGQVIENPFVGRDGHVACAVGSHLYVFGGLKKTPGEIGASESNELLCFSVETQTWTRVETKGEVPAPRVGATMQSVDGQLYLFGGISQESGWLRDFHKFDVATSTWSVVEASGQAPSARDKLSSAVIGSNIYIFGGFGPQGMEEEEEIVEEDEELDEDEEELDEEGMQFGWFNDLHVFNTETKAWSSPMYMNLSAPTPRAASGVCAVDKYLVVFGGRDAVARRNDLHILDTETRKWVTDLKVKGQQPEPRSFHTVTTVGPRVVVIGGRGTENQHFNDIHIFDTLAQQWLQPKVSGDVTMTARGTHTATVVGDKLVVYGGSSDFDSVTMQCQNYHSDIAFINTVDIKTGGALTTTQENKENATNPNIMTNGDVMPGKPAAIVQENGTALQQ